MSRVFEKKLGSFIKSYPLFEKTTLVYECLDGYINVRVMFMYEGGNLYIMTLFIKVLIVDAWEQARPIAD
jgi:hypothetical protein